MATLALRKLHKSFGDTPVIDGIDLQVHDGDFCVFVGPSGCGKSTLLRMIAGLERVSAGEVAIDGKVVNHLSAAQRGLAMVFQSYALYPHMSVRGNLSFGLENMNLPKPEIRARVDEAARMLQIEELLKRKPGQLSGGQRQRVAIGRAVVREPKIFLFDEPLSNLDAELRVAMRAEIAALHRRLGNTMVYVTHDQVEAMTMADRIAVLRAGRIEQYGKPLELYNRPHNRFVAGFIGSPRMNFLDGEVTCRTETELQLTLADGAVLVLDSQQFAGDAGQPVTLGVRANHVEVTDTQGAQLVMQAQTIEQLGGETYVYGATADNSSMTLHLPGQAAIERGDTIGLRIAVAKVQVFDERTGLSLRC